MKSVRILMILSFFMAFLNMPGSYSQNAPTHPAILGLTMPGFTLPALQGGDYSVDAMRGKILLIVFPRGHVQDSNTWCNICQYQYAELADLEIREHVREKYNMEILFILPYGKSSAEKWVATMPDQLREVEKWKYPIDTVKLSDNMKHWMEISRKLYPRKFDFGDGKAPVPLPILYDVNHTVTSDLDIFRTEWSGSKVDQNMPTVVIVDRKGVVRFKYISQKTYDRPDAKYLMDEVEKVSKMP